MRILQAGDGALLAELDGLASAQALYRQLLAEPVAGVAELVPAARTVLVRFQPALLAASALAAILRKHWLAAQASSAVEVAAGPLVEIPVCYDGEDLAAVAELMGISEAEVIARHTGQPWQAAFAGFAPGFVYLTGGHPSFQLPRRASPRTRVPAGAVALAGDFSAVYPSASPGGWQLIGTTGLPMWDLQREQPPYVQPGFWVQFVDAGPSALQFSVSAPAHPQPQPAEGGAMIEFEQAGLQTLVQDGGRHGLARLGVSPSGALDQTAMRAANRLVGNPPQAPVLENLLGGLRLRSHGRTTLAVSGAGVSLMLEDRQGRQWPRSCQAAVALDDGDCLIVSAPAAGLRCYVAVRGGWEVAPVLGSCARDTLSHIGPPPVQNGQRLAVGTAFEPQQLRSVEVADATVHPCLPRAGELVTVDVIPGPRADWFSAAALELFERQPWQVTAESNRIGIRLQGEQGLTRCRSEELPSEAVVAGAIQVPASGQPVIFLADHPVTGGYPVIAVVASHHLPLLAQLPPGCSLRFRVIAGAALLENEADHE